MQRLDETDDSVFYSTARFVQHVDDSFERQLHGMHVLWAPDVGVC